jgi:hypothetical protein
MTDDTWLCDCPALAKTRLERGTQMDVISLCISRGKPPLLPRREQMPHLFLLGTQVAFRVLVWFDIG